MFYRNHGRHSVSRVRTRKVGILLLQDSKLPGIAVDHGCEARLEADKVGSALLCENIVTEAEYIFLEGIDELECYLHFDIL